MKKALLYLYFLLLPLGLEAQKDCPLFDKYIEKGEAELKKGAKADIKKAIEAFTNAMVHCPAKAAEARNKIVKAFDAINALKTQAEKNAILTEKALKDTKNAQIQADSARIKAQATLYKINFYDGKFGLAYINGRYGFIDKNLQTKIDFKYEEALPFNDGWAKVKRENINYLIDTTGTEYPLATNINQLNSEITALDLSNQNLNKISPSVFEQTQLKVLLLNGNRIQKIPEGLEKLTELHKLDISQNQISKIEGLEKLIKLQQLNLSSENQIIKIEGLEKLTKLQQLDISVNQIIKIEGIENLKDLQKLDITDNQISKLEGLEKLSALQTLYISENQISKLEGLDKLTALKILDISENQISEKEVEKLKKVLPNCIIKNDY